MYIWRLAWLDQGLKVTEVMTPRVPGVGFARKRVRQAFERDSGHRRARRVGNTLCAMPAIGTPTTETLLLRLPEFSVPGGIDAAQLIRAVRTRALSGLDCVVPTHSAEPRDLGIERIGASDVASPRPAQCQRSVERRSTSISPTKDGPARALPFAPAWWKASWRDSLVRPLL
jgi:hypothetical protein